MIPTERYNFLQPKQKSKTTGLITGCFDILHKGHKGLFTFAKKYCDILIVGVESDKTIQLSKGKNRPLNPQKKRIQNLRKIKEINYVFPINIVTTFGKKDVAKKYLSLIKKVKPDYLITNITADKYWRQKEKAIKRFGIKLIKQKERLPISTTKIISSLPGRNL